MYPLITDICEESTPERGLVLSEKNIALMNIIMNFNYRYIYRHPRLKVYHNYAALIIRSIYEALAHCYDGRNTINRIQALQDDYPILGTHFLERLYKYSDIGRKWVNVDAFGNPYGNQIIYAITTDEKAYRQACVDYIAGMTDRYAEKLFQEMTTL